MVKEYLVSPTEYKRHFKLSISKPSLPAALSTGGSCLSQPQAMHQEILFAPYSRDLCLTWSDLLTIGSALTATNSPLNDFRGLPLCPCFHQCPTVYAQFSGKRDPFKM